MAETKKIIVGLIILSTLLTFPQSFLATENIIIEKEFETTNSNFNYNFEKEIVKDHKKYMLNENSIKYEILSQNTDVKKITETVQKENLKNQDDNEFEKTLIKDDKTYNLEKVEWVPSLGDTRLSIATGKIDYPYSTTPPSPSPTHTFKYIDVDNNNTVIPVNLNFVNITNSSYSWIDDFVVDVEIIGYDKPYYSFNNKLIPKNEQYPLLKGYEQDYLSHLGLSSDSYQLKSSEWISEPYTDNEGITKRKARLSGSRYVATFTANYQSQVELPQLEELTGTATYVYQDVANSTTTYKVKALASYDEVLDHTSTIIAISVAFIILIGFIIFTIFVLRRKKDNEVK